MDQLKLQVELNPGPYRLSPTERLDPVFFAPDNEFIITAHNMPDVRQLAGPAAQFRADQFEHDLRENYREQERLHWSAEERKLTDKERQFMPRLQKISPVDYTLLCSILIMFRSADGIVNAFHFVRTLAIFRNSLIQACVIIQMSREVVHNFAYDHLLTLLPPDLQRQANDTTQYHPVIYNLLQWATTWINDPNVTMVDRLVAFAFYEGVAFMAQFQIIIKFMETYTELPALGIANLSIAADEMSHTRLTCTLLRHLTVARPTQATVEKIAKSLEAVLTTYTRFNLGYDRPDLTPTRTVALDKILSGTRHQFNLVAQLMGASPIYPGTTPADAFKDFALPTRVDVFNDINTAYSSGLTAASSTIDRSQLAAKRAQALQGRGKPTDRRAD